MRKKADDGPEAVAEAAPTDDDRANAMGLPELETHGVTKQVLWTAGLLGVTRAQLLASTGVVQAIARLHEAMRGAGLLKEG